MTRDGQEIEFVPNKRKAFAKLALLAAGLLACIALLVLAIDDSALDQIKFELTITAMIVLVVIINLVSFVCFILMYAAYQWVRCDLKAPRSEDLRDGD